MGFLLVLDPDIMGAGDLDTGAQDTGEGLIMAITHIEDTATEIDVIVVEEDIIITVQQEE